MQFLAAILPPLLALATLGDTTQKEMILFVLHHPRWSRQVGGEDLRHGIANVFTQKLRQRKHNLRKA